VLLAPAELDVLKSQMSDIESAAARLDRLHGVRSRSDDASIEAEVNRLNASVRDLARGLLTPWDQPGDFAQVALRQADRYQRLAPEAVRAPTASGTDPLRWTIPQMAAALRAQHLSVTELTQLALGRARAVQDLHRPFIELQAEAALARAHTLDQELASGRWRGPLHGIPLAHKDCFERAGRAPTVGSRATDLPAPTQDAAALARLQHAGTVDMGPLNLNEMVAGPTGHNPHFGDCTNALDPQRIGGGSSSGSGVAVALGVVVASLGSDTGGSIRIPAAVNGVVGLKPTYGRVSRAGCFPRAFSLDCIGPLARDVDSCQAVFEAIAGPDQADPSSLVQPGAMSPALSADDGAGQAGAVPTRLGLLQGWGTLTSDVGTAFSAFLDRCDRAFGALARTGDVGMEPLYALGDTISKVEAAALHGQWMAHHPEDYSRAVYSRTEPGFHLPAVRYLEAVALRARLLDRFLTAAFDKADVLVYPCVPVPVPLRTEADMEQGSAVFSVVPQLTRLTRPFSYLGLPVLVIPIGLDAYGMPVAAQLVGRPFGEDRLFDVARRLIASPR
jgi:aspartyl-tRNA(Asn)/glutamyl-tRNA(Gln) amidotransferase subunit A